MSRWKQLVEYAVIRLLGVVASMLSARSAKRWGSRFSWLMTRGLPQRWTRYRVAYDNISQAYGGSLSEAEIETIIQGMWEHLFRLLVETTQFPRKLSRENFREVIRFRNRQAVVRALSTGRPVYLLGGHFGNWEATTAVFGMFGLPMGIVARELDNPYLHRWVVETRESTGHKLLLKQGAWDEIGSILQNGGNLGLLCDQDAGRRGVFVNFFGRPASTFKSIALMAIEQRALLVVGYGMRAEDDFDEARWARFEIGCEEIIDAAEFTSAQAVRELTQRYTAALERCIRRAPEQYFWVHRRWKTEPKSASQQELKAA
jgi:KDO2-lipid IV(A) lauroyltransferase